jgi:2-oxoglutarate ferredoxin oxidoreductase subunit gamma
MRGGPSRAGVVIGDAPLRALPVLPSYWSAIVAHHRFSGPALARLRPGGPVVVNAPLVDPALVPPGARVYPVDAASLAPQAVGFVLLGAYNAITRLVAPQSLVDAMVELLPPYRRQHAPANERALALGAAELAHAHDGAEHMTGLST